MVQHSAASVFHALGDPTRLALVDRLARSPQRLSDLAAPLEMSFQAVRKHVNVLEAAGLVRSTRKGRERVCRIEPRTLAASARWLGSRAELWERRLERFAALFEETEEST